jgi:arylsulfatase A-like enzyme
MRIAMVSPASGSSEKSIMCGEIASGGLEPIRAQPVTVLALAIAIGLSAGFLDLGLMILKKQAFDHGFYRLGDGFWWITPVGVAILVMIPSLILAASALWRRSGIRLDIAAGLISFPALLDLIARLPIYFWPSLLLSAGLAVQLSRFLRSHGPRLLALLRPVVLLLVTALLVVLLLIQGSRTWSEYQAASSLPPPPQGAHNVLLIVWDTVRAANSSLYGYGRPTTPHLERLASRGLRFSNAFATSPWTLPSHGSVLTGRWPHELTADWKSALDGTYPTLAGHLATMGYDTAGFVANLDYCSRETGLARGFAHYEDYPLNAWEIFTRYVGLGRRIDLFSMAFIIDNLAGGHLTRPSPAPRLSKEHAKSGADINLSFLNWLSWQRKRGRPFFAFLNYNDAHSPYELPERSAGSYGLRPSSWRDLSILKSWLTLDKSRLSTSDVQMAIDVYDQCITDLDRRLNNLVDELARRGVLDDTLLIVTSDHGEHLGDHLLFFHGCSLYRQLLAVPLVIVDPKYVPSGRVVAQPVSLRDLPATVVDLLGLASSPPFPGRSLARLWNSRDEENPLSSEPLLMETEKPPLLVNQGREPAAKGPMTALVVGGMHYIRSGDGQEELFSVNSDPDERLNLAGLPQAQSALQGFRRTMQDMLRPIPRRSGQGNDRVEKRGAGADSTRRSLSQAPRRSGRAIALGQLSGVEAHAQSEQPVGGPAADGGEARTAQQ